MRFWLCITTEENWKVIKEKNVWGRSIEMQLQRLDLETNV